MSNEKKLREQARKNGFDLIADNPKAPRNILHKAAENKLREAKEDHTYYVLRDLDRSVCAWYCALCNARHAIHHTAKHRVHCKHYELPPDFDDFRRNIDGVVHLNPAESELERKLFRKFEDMLLDRGFTYLSIPSCFRWNSLAAQEIFDTSSIKGRILGVDDKHCLSGSAEQGFLDRYRKAVVGSGLYFAKNQCFRPEKEYEGLKTVKEFRKIEQYAFCLEENWEKVFELLLGNATDFFDHFGIEYRIVDCTDSDPGYHLLKKDIEVKTEKYGWMETHSCTYFGSEQTERLKIRTTRHTISNTGLASPRVLIPFLEADIDANHPLMEKEITIDRELDL